MTPKDQLREKVEKALEGCDFVFEVGAVDNVLTLIASSTKEAVETCVRVVEEAVPEKKVWEKYIDAPDKEQQHLHIGWNAARQAILSALKTYKE